MRDDWLGHYISQPTYQRLKFFRINQLKLNNKEIEMLVACVDVSLLKVKIHAVITQELVNTHVTYCSNSH